MSNGEPGGGPSAGREARQPGRPLSTKLTDQLLSMTLELLAEDGWHRFNADRLATRVRAGKASIYRRWRSLEQLAHHALRREAIVHGVPSQGSLRADLLGLLKPWTRPLVPAERAAASFLGDASRDPELHAALDESVVGPLNSAVQAILERQAARGMAVSHRHAQRLELVIQALWWQRLSAFHTHLTDAQAEQLVDRVLIPIVFPAASATTS